MAGNIKGKGARRAQGEWRLLLAKFSASGLGVSAFCRSEGFSEASFYRWRARLSDAVGRGDVLVQECAASFVDLGAVNARSSPGARLDLKLDLGDGVVLHLVRS
jgi:putative transposase